jgi:hypothetical protein
MVFSMKWCSALNHGFCQLTTGYEGRTVLAHAPNPCQRAAQNEGLDTRTLPGLVHLPYKTVHIAGTAIA